MEKITVKHLRIAINEGTACVTGAINFCKLHNIDWKDFVKNGIEVKELEKVNDETARNLIFIYRRK